MKSRVCRSSGVVRCRWALKRLQMQALAPKKLLLLVGWIVSVKHLGRGNRVYFRTSHFAQHVHL